MEEFIFSANQQVWPEFSWNPVEIMLLIGGQWGEGGALWHHHCHHKCISLRQPMRGQVERERLVS